MSQWTHVNGLVRIDAMPKEVYGIDIYPELMEKLGNTAFFQDSEDVWNKCSVPCGSEGSLYYSVRPSENDDYGLCWGTISIWGDLRDYDNLVEIHNWILKFCTSKNYFVRSCSVKVDIEYSNSYIIYDFQEEGKDIQIVSQVLGK